MGKTLDFYVRYHPPPPNRKYVSTPLCSDNSTYAVGLLSLSFPIQIAYSPPPSISFTETVVGRVIEDLTPQNNIHQHYIYFYGRRNIVFVLLQ